MPIIPCLRRCKVTVKKQGYVASHRLLARNQGSVLLIPHGNPKGIGSIQDLMRDDIRLFISNPVTEAVSHDGYRQTLEGLALRRGIAAETFSEAVFCATALWGESIHHREAPESVAAGEADVAIVYYHLALRYTRIFPGRFDFVPLGGTRQQPMPDPENLTVDIHIGRVGDSGAWGQRLLDFMQCAQVAKIYTEHGLVASPAK